MPRLGHQFKRNVSQDTSFVNGDRGPIREKDSPQEKATYVDCMFCHATPCECCINATSDIFTRELDNS